MVPSLLSTTFLLGCGSSAPDAPAITGDRFTVLVASDPQVWWQTRKDEPCKQGKKACSKQNNDRQTASMSKAGELQWPAGMASQASSTVAEPVALIVNGDLTSFWHPNEKKNYEKWFGPDSDKLPSSLVRLVGLGNHDIANNVCDCSGYFPWGSNSCVRDAISTFRDWYDDVSWISFDDCSLAYSFDIGGIHFVQLNVSPSFSLDASDGRGCTGSCTDGTNALAGATNPDCGDYKIYQAFDWLEKDLEAAAGKPVLLNMHAARDQKYWKPDGDMARFRSIVAKHDVVAVFGGHIHKCYGYEGAYDLDGTVTNASGAPVRFFRSGASEFETYLLVELGSDGGRRYMNVGVVGSADHAFMTSNTNGPEESCSGPTVAPQTFWLD